MSHFCLSVIWIKNYNYYSLLFSWLTYRLSLARYDWFLSVCIYELWTIFLTVISSACLSVWLISVFLYLWIKNYFSNWHIVCLSRGMTDFVCLYLRIIINYLHCQWNTFCLSLHLWIMNYFPNCHIVCLSFGMTDFYLSVFLYHELWHIACLPLCMYPCY